MEVDPEFQKVFDVEVDAAMGKPNLEDTSENGAISGIDDSAEFVLSFEEQSSQEDSLTPQGSVGEEEDEKEETATEEPSEDEDPEEEIGFPLHKAFQEANLIMVDFYEEVLRGEHIQLSNSELRALCAERKTLALATFETTTEEDQEAIKNCCSKFRTAHLYQLQAVQRRWHVRHVLDDISGKYEGQIYARFDASWLACETLDHVCAKIEQLEDVPEYDSCDLILIKSLGTDRKSFKTMVKAEVAAWFLDVIKQFRQFKKEVSEILESRKFISEADLQLKNKEKKFFESLDSELPEGLQGPVKEVLQELKEDSKEKMATKLCNEQVRYVIAIEYACQKFKELLEAKGAEEMYAIISRCFNEATRKLKYPEQVWQWPSEKPDQIKKYWAAQRKSKPNKVTVEMLTAMTSSDWDQLLLDCPPEALAQLEAKLARARQNAAASSAATKRIQKM